jgi:acyl-CoA thioesterase FadM
VHIESDFFQPIKYGDEPDIHLGILRIGNSSVEFGYWMTLDGNDAPLCRAQITTASVNMNTMATQAIPEKWRVAFQEYLIPDGDFPTAR